MACSICFTGTDVADDPAGDGLVDDRASAEDVVQDPFAAVYRKRAALRDPEQATAYLRAAVVNAARSMLRRRGTARGYLRLVQAEDEHVPGADHRVLHDDAHSRVRAALADLAERQREVLSLRFLAGLTDAEIVAATGLSAGNVRSAASRGVSALRISMGGQL
jgi:RNA polymerase sigma factor (sigma-70 family)